MAATGFTPIQLYYSITPTNTPLAANLAYGELALNSADGRLFYKNYVTGLTTLLADGSTATGNLPGGNTGTVVYQSSTGVTAYLPLATTGYLLVAGSSTPTYVNPSTVSVGSANIAATAGTASTAGFATTSGTATNVAGGTANQLLYQTGAGSTSFVTTPSTAGLVLGWTGSAFAWVSAPAATTAANLAGGAAFEVPYQSAPNTTQFSTDFQFNGTYLRVGDTTPLTGATNPTFAATGNQNLYVQSYIYNANSGTSASADFVAYSDLSTDTHGWIDMGYTSSNYADAAYSVTAQSEGYIFSSAPLGAGLTGNMVFATDSTGSENAFQWYVGGFAQSKSAWKMQLTSAGLQLDSALAPAYGGTGLTTVGAIGNILTSNGSIWVSAAPPVTGPSTAKTYYMAQF